MTQKNDVKTKESLQETNMKNRGIKKTNIHRFIGSLNVYLAQYYTLKEPYVTGCANGLQVLGQEECEKAYEAIKDENQLSTVRGIQAGEFSDIPLGCSVQWDNPNFDQAPYWNIATESTNALVNNGEFRVICKPFFFLHK